MKKKTEMILGIVLFLLGILLPGSDVRAEMISQPGYVKTTQAQEVYAGPGQAYAKVGILEKDTVAIVYGRTQDNWCRVYFLGTAGYIMGDKARPFQGNEKAENKPLFQAGSAPVVMNVLGDSITAGEKLRSQKESYAALLGNYMGAIAVRNYGLEGSCVAGMHPDRFLDRYVQMDRNANWLLVFGGTNDYGFGTPLGTYGDTTQETFYGGLNQLMCGLQQMYPAANIVFLTPILRDKDTVPNEYGNTLRQYAQAVVEMGAFYDIPVIDVYTPAELHFANQKSVYMRDGIHPNAKAHKILADYLYQRLSF